MKRDESRKSERKIVLDWVHSQAVVYEINKFDRAYKGALRSLVCSFFIKDYSKDLDSKFSEKFGKSKEPYFTRQEYKNRFFYEGRSIEIEFAQASESILNNKDVLWRWILYNNRLKARPENLERLKLEFAKYQNKIKIVREKVREANSIAILRKLDEDDEGEDDS